MKIFVKIVLLVLAVTGACAGGFLYYERTKWDGLPVSRSRLDTNKNGINDTDDLILGARAEAKRKPKYRSVYYQGGYPPPHEGVCTDVVWRAFRHAGYDLKAMVDADIQRNISAYPRVSGKPDPNIDFRRVPNLLIFFQRHATPLTCEIIPDNPVSLAEWQGGDIVIFKGPHIVVLSDKRNWQGVPWIIHNNGPKAKEANQFMKWYDKGVLGHFRFPKE